ncbi:hypothetical protein I4U23_020132 [Adineta vaga]|nr:hypothetical protein I4U23_020132 [Adineta vaga]
MVDYEDLSFAVEEEEEEGIDPERIVNDHQQIAKEFFCAICQGLLWKPRSCGSCQHLFCTKCIRAWLKINPTICPFRCSSRLTLHCRNSSFGCTEILSYDQLEQHQTTDCQFPTKQCRICQKYILLSLLDQHQTSCIPTSIECFLCNLSY